QIALREETFSRNYERAAQLYQKAAAQGHPQAKYFLAQMFLEGRGVPKDIERAIWLLTDSSDAGYEKARMLLAEVRAARSNAQDGQEICRQEMSDDRERFRQADRALQAGDHPTAFSIWHRLAKDGNARAQFNLGLMYFMGWGVTRDLTQAARWYRL